MAATVAREIAEKRMVELSCDGEWILMDRIISCPLFFHVVVVACNLPCTVRKCVCGDDLMSTLTHSPLYPLPDVILPASH